MTEFNPGFGNNKPQYERARGLLELLGLPRREAIHHLIEDLLQFELPIAARYKHLDVIQILQDNCSSSEPGLDALMQGLSILERYGKNLLRPERPLHWRVVRFSNNIFKQKVDVIKGARGILKLLGYSKSVEDGLSYPDDCRIPDTSLVASITADIMLLRQELLMLANKDHPQEGDFYSYVAVEQIRSVQAFFELTKTPVSPSPEPPLPPSYNAVGGGGKEKRYMSVELEGDTFDMDSALPFLFYLSCG